jgi:hypothetical protein
MKHPRLSAVAAFLTIGMTALPPVTAQESGSEIELILERVDVVLRQVAEVRGLASQGPIAAGIYDRETLRSVLIERVAEQMSAEQFRVEQRLLRELGVLDWDTDYYELMIGLFTSQIAGFYDEDEQKLFLIDDLPLAALEPTLAHELFHGIQDQVYGINTVRGLWERSDDSVLATTALIEGDATAVMIDFSIGGAISFTDIPNFVSLIESQFGSWEDLAESGLPPEIPGFFKTELIFPYLQGLQFVHFLKASGGWELVNQAYVDPPLSSEQVLHPERYLDRDDPTWLELDTTVIEAEGFLRVYDQVFGQFHWRSVLTELLGDTVAARAIDNAVAGWDGDRLLALETPTDDFVILALTIWDSEQDAVEFEAVLLRAVEMLQGRPLEPIQEGANGALNTLEERGEWVVVERWGDMVLYLSGVPSELVDDGAPGWREAIWGGRVRSAYPPHDRDGRE